MLVLSTFLVASVVIAAPAESASEDPPNIILVVTDDQRWDTMDSMPWLKRYARRSGSRFDMAYAPLPQCCPARTSLLTGMYPHNHGVWKSAPSVTPGALGGHAGVSALESATVATWLDAAGYTTSLIGKYVNGFPAYSGDDARWRVPPGWDEWASITSAPPSAIPRASYGRGYLSFTLAVGDADGVSHIDAYRGSTDTVFRFLPGAKTPEQVESSGTRHSTPTLGGLARESVVRNAEDPFFLWLNFMAPHVGPIPTDESATIDVPSVDRTVNGYIENDATDEELVAAGKPAWVRNMPSMSSYECTESYSSSYKCVDEATSLEMEADQRRTLHDVDREMRKLFRTLETTLDENGRPLIETTYVIFTSDHGFMWGEHRIAHSKGVPYQESIAVPFIVFGPDASPGKHAVPVSLVDVAPTILDWAGIDRSKIEAKHHALDGESLAGLVTGSISSTAFARDVRAGVLVESHARQGTYYPDVMEMPRWRAFVTKRWKVIQYGRGHRTVVNDPYGIAFEAYDLRSDPHELQSMAAPGVEHPSGVKRARKWLRRLATCSGTSGAQSCSIPGSARPGD